MKQFLFTILFVGAGFLQNQAQSYVQLLDSIVYFSIQSSGDSTRNDKRDYRYDNENHEIYKGYSRWDSNLRTWNNQEYIQHTYNHKNLLIEKVEHRIGGMQFGFERHCWEYDLLGNPLIEYLYIKWVETDEWMPWTKQDIKSTESGQPIQKLEYKWNKANADWLPNLFYSFTYDTHGFEVFQLIEIYNFQTKSWQNKRKTEITYNDFGVKISDKEYFWYPDSTCWRSNTVNWCEYDSLGRKIRTSSLGDESTWITEYFYDSVGNYTSFIYGRNWPDTVWGLHVRTEVKFNQDKKIISLIEYYKNADEWMKSRNFQYLYNDSGLIIELTDYVGDRNTNEWVLNYQQRAHYNSLGNRRLSEGYLWNAEIENWILRSRGHYYYQNLSTSKQETTIETFFIYPNPTTGVVNLSGALTGTMLRIYNSTGVQIKQEIIANEMVDLSEWPAGIYFLVLIDKRGTMLRYPVIKK